VGPHGKLKMLYEQHHHQLLSWPGFLRRAGQHAALGGLIAAIAVAIGTIGYHELDELDWIDSFLNASMILSGMGPVDKMNSSSAKVFAALYALFSGLVFIGIMGIVLAPWFHRLMHTFHVEKR
jgi:hypothetical protein